MVNIQSIQFSSIFVYIGDGDIFQYDCNTCTCVDGTKVCTDKDCKVVYSNGRFMRRI